MISILLRKALLNNNPQNRRDDLLIVFGLIAENLELFLLEQEQTIGCADLPRLGVDPGDLRIDEFGHDDLAV